MTAVSSEVAVSSAEAGTGSSDARLTRAEGLPIGVGTVGTALASTVSIT